MSRRVLVQPLDQFLTPHLLRNFQINNEKASQNLSPQSILKRSKYNIKNL